MNNIPRKPMKIATNLRHPKGSPRNRKAANGMVSGRICKMAVILANSILNRAVTIKNAAPTSAATRSDKITLSRRPSSCTRQPERITKSVNKTTTIPPRTASVWKIGSTPPRDLITASFTAKQIIEHTIKSAPRILSVMGLPSLCQ